MTAQLPCVADQTVRIGEQTLTLREITPNDRQAVLALHTMVFGPEVDSAWFAWKYGQQPGQGYGQAAGMWCDGELIAFCGGLPRVLWQKDKPLHGMQMGDVMVHPQWRGILTRRGPFFHVTKSFHSSRLGSPPTHPYQLGFGFPNDRALRLPVKLGLVWDAGVIESLHWKTALPTELHLPWLWRWRELFTTDPAFDQKVSTAWQTMQSNLGNLTVGQRDARYLRWRYVNRPASCGAAPQSAARYRFFELRRVWSAKPVGVAVLDLRSTSAHWLDWVGPVDLMPIASTACRIEAASAGATELTAWASLEVAKQLDETNIARREICAGLGVSADSDLQPDHLAGLRFWLMGGDTDFL